MRADSLTSLSSILIGLILLIRQLGLPLKKALLDFGGARRVSCWSAPRHSFGAALVAARIEPVILVEPSKATIFSFLGDPSLKFALVIL